MSEATKAVARCNDYADPPIGRWCSLPKGHADKHRHNDSLRWELRPEGCPHDRSYSAAGFCNRCGEKIGQSLNEFAAASSRETPFESRLACLRCGSNTYNPQCCGCEAPHKPASRETPAASFVTNASRTIEDERDRQAAEADAFIRGETPATPQDSAHDRCRCGHIRFNHVQTSDGQTANCMEKGCDCIDGYFAGASRATEPRGEPPVITEESSWGDVYSAYMLEACQRGELEQKLASLSAENVRLKKELENEQLECGSLIDERDRREDQITAICNELGGTAEWSNACDLGDEAAVLAKNLFAENARLRERLLDWENREAAICPEDVGFEEAISTLRTLLARSRAETTALVEGKVWKEGSPAAEAPFWCHQDAEGRIFDHDTAQAALDAYLAGAHQGESQ